VKLYAACAKLYAACAKLYAACAKLYAACAKRYAACAIVRSLRCIVPQPARDVCSLMRIRVQRTDSAGRPQMQVRRFQPADRHRHL
jgi:hypothetical protein